MDVRKKLKFWCRENSLEYLAYKADVTAGYIHKLIRGERVPSVKVAKKIQIVTSGYVAAKAWDRIRAKAKN